MVLLEDVKAADEARLGRVEQREELEILDLMVPMEVGEQHVQAGSEPGLVGRRRHQAFAEFEGPCLKLAAEVAEAVMDLQPEAGHGAEIGMARPDLARKAIEENPEVVGPAGAGVEVESHVGGI